MGLFSRKPKNDKPKDGTTSGDEAPVFDLLAELAAIKDQLAASESARADLEARLQHLDEANTAVSTQIGTLDESRARLDLRLEALDQGLAMVGDKITALSGSTTRLEQRLDAVGALDARLDELTARVEAPTPLPPTATIPPPPTSPPPPPPPLASAAVTGERADEMAAQLDALAEAVAAHTDAMAATQIRLGEIDDLAALIDAGDAT